MNKIGFNLDKINTLQFAIIEDSYNESNDDFNLDINLGFGIDFNNTAILSLVKIHFEQEEKPFLIIEVSCEFKIADDFWSDFSDKVSIKIPMGFMAHLAMITVGTTRGVLHSKTKDTKFNDFILPTINVAEMIKEDGVFSK